MRHFKGLSELMHSNLMKKRNHFIPNGKWSPLSTSTLSAYETPDDTPEYFELSQTYNRTNNDELNEEAEKLKSFIENSNYLVAITGAGVSTDSGIPDYRGPQGSYKRGHKPITHSEFINQENARKRYWARSMVGWQRMENSKPNATHYSLAKLEDNGILQYLITQNVDRLHQQAGSKKVIDLHGRIDRVKCLCCDTKFSRRIIQEILIELNPIYSQLIEEKLSLEEENEKLRADGDIDLGIQDYSQFNVPMCNKCGGVLKPDVIFFGDNVPRENVEFIYRLIEQSDSLLVVGTSLEVFSAYRFVDKANKLNIPIAIVNNGVTRAERQALPMIKYKSDSNCTKLLKSVVDRLSIQ